MAELTDIISYILAKYPHDFELSNARVTKMVYLADWRQAITEGSQVSEIRWYFNSYGPFVWDVKDTIENETETFEVTHTRNMFGTEKLLFKLKGPPQTTSLTDSERAALDHVIENTKNLSWNGFIRLVYSTHPIVTSGRYSHLDLVAKAQEYKDGNGIVTTESL